MKDSSTFVVKPLEKATDFVEYRNKVDILSNESNSKSPYLTGFAVSRRAIEAALRLRYEVFNIELGEGLSSSEETGLDEDRFDLYMTQLVLLEKDTHKVAGTYRLQTMKQALVSPEGSYSGQEYNLEALQPFFDFTTECGRACLAIEHRKMKALIQLWHGIGAFMNLYNQKYLFGCCSLSSTNPELGWLAYESLNINGQLHKDIRLPTNPQYHCLNKGPAPSEKEISTFKLPKLFRIYLRLGASVISEPALDLDFKTIDFLVLLKAPDVSMTSLNVVH